MNIVVTAFTNPFSFFCKVKNDEKEVNLPENSMDTTQIGFTKTEISDVSHGQYVAVMWKNKWTRGIVSMESQFLIWLIDYGIYVRPDDKTVYTDLPSEYRKYPSKIFEASIHGVTPLDMVLSEDCLITNQISTSWTKGAVEKAQELIKNADKLIFVPVALLSTKSNDIVIGDLYLEIKNHGIINIIEEMKLWPVFLQPNPELYIQNMSIYYTSRRRHRACILKPVIADNLPRITLEINLDEYSAIYAETPRLETSLQYKSDSEDGSTVAGYKVKREENFRLTPDEIQKFSKMNVMVCGREYNVLNVLINKIRDLKMCEKYKDHDKKSVGRGVIGRLSDKMSGEDFI